MSVNSDACVTFVVNSVRKRRPFVRLVDRRHVELLVRHLYWACLTRTALRDAYDLRRAGLAWLRRQRAFPWWVLLLLRLALPVIVQLVLSWFNEHEGL